MRHALRIGATALAALVLLNLAGCGGSDNSGGGPADDAAGGSPQAANVPREGPAASAYTFLEGARLGDDEKVASMLTQVARRELARKGLTAGPPCTDTARFVLGEVRYAGPEIAQVASRWTDVDAETGQPHSTDMTWVLRKEEGQWRVGGLALTVFEGEPPLLLNYEDPEDMLRQRQMLKEEMARRRAAQQSPTPPAIADKPGETVPR